MDACWSGVECNLVHPVTRLLLPQQCLHGICVFVIVMCVQVESYEEIIIETINLCCYYYENNMYMVPKEKYVLLKVC